MRKINFLFVLGILIALNGCVSRRTDVIIDPTNLRQLETVVVPAPNPADYSDACATGFNSSQIRTKALEDTAMSIAAQGGLAWSSRNINRRLQKDKWYLETIFNFNGMMLEHGILPPVLTEGDNSLNLADPNTIRIADKTYKIVSQARFATTPPNWRDYLWMNYPIPEIPNKYLLPRNCIESRIWIRAVRIGWGKGIEQSYNIFQQNLARLKRDYRGMILYKKLLEQRMISPPFVATTELGVTGNGEDMRINDQVLRIVETPQLQTNSNQWKAIVVKHDP